MAMLRRSSSMFRYLAGRSYEWRRGYFLPPSPSPMASKLLAAAGVYQVVDSEINVDAVKAAQFATQVVDESCQFVRVLRASKTLTVSGHEYYLTLEALTGKADMNVYYAQVVNKTRFHMNCLNNITELVKWQLIDQSFSYPFEDLIRQPKSHENLLKYDKVAVENPWVRSWYEFADGRKKFIRNNDDLDLYHMLEGHKNLPRGLKSLTTISDINKFAIVYESALFAVTTYNKNEEDKVCLKNIRYAWKCKDDNNGIYRLVLEATNGENELNSYYAIVKTDTDKNLELIKWNLLPKTFFDKTGEEASNQGREC